MTNSPAATVLSLAQLLERQSPAPPPCLVEPGLLPAQGILFVGGEPKVGKSLLVALLADIIFLLTTYTTHLQVSNALSAVAALCKMLLRSSQASRAALIVVHHVRKSIGRYEIGSAFRGSSALHAVGDSYLLLTRPSPQFNTVELRFQFRYAAPQPPRLLQLDSAALWFSATGEPPAPVRARRKVETADVQRALTTSGSARFNEL